MENPIKMDDLGVPLFLETPTWSGVPWFGPQVTRPMFGYLKGWNRRNHWDWTGTSLRFGLGIPWSSQVGHKKENLKTNMTTGWKILHFQ